MAHIPGKYELAQNKNYYELLIKVGAPEDHAKAANEAKSTLEVTIDGNNINFVSDALLQKSVSDLVVNKEVDESFPNNITVKSTTKLDGNVITVDSTSPEGTIKRVYTFTANGVEVLVVITRAGVTAEATRIFKRV